jgi:hypothetical protein
MLPNRMACTIGEGADRSLKPVTGALLDVMMVFGMGRCLVFRIQEVTAGMADRTEMAI